MAEKRRFLDLWIIETNTVYKEVPYAVALDWVQQGRLLEGDMYKPSGTKDWFRFGAAPEFQPFFPRRDESRPDDQTEAMESVDLEFSYKKPHGDEDDDIDMIPLIDVSLVLLVFFMLTATSATAVSPVRTPPASHGQMLDNSKGLRIDITPDKDGSPIYALGIGDQPPQEEEKDLRSLQAVLNRLRVRLTERDGTIDLLINAHEDLESGHCRELLLGLRASPFRERISTNYYGVSDKVD